MNMNNPHLPLSFNKDFPKRRSMNTGPRL